MTNKLGVWILALLPFGLSAQNTDVNVRLTSLKIDGNAAIHWTVINENNTEYRIQEYRQTAWIQLFKIDGNESGSYTEQMTPGDGANQWRIVACEGKKCIPWPVMEFNRGKPIGVGIRKYKDSIALKDAEEPYEIFDTAGNSLIKGYDSKVEISKLTEGLYYIWLDGVTEPFIKSSN